MYRKRSIEREWEERFETGEVLNHMQLDAQRVGDLMLFIHVIWSGLFQIIKYIALLYMYIGWSVFGGLFLLIS